MLIVWDSLFETGIEVIDIQHKRLVRIINEVYDSFSRKGTVENLTVVLDELIDYTHTHFATEEKFFKKFGYDLSDEHIAEHLNFTLKVEDFISKVKTRTATLGYEVINFLKEWLINHILDSDKKYVLLFKQNGL